MAEINKVDANRYRIKSDGGIIWLSAREMLDILAWLQAHEQRLTDEMYDAMVHEALDAESE